MTNEELLEQIKTRIDTMENQILFDLNIIGKELKELKYYTKETKNRVQEHVHRSTNQIQNLNLEI